MARRVYRPVLGLAAAVTMVMALTSQPASAHYTYISEAGYFASTDSNHFRISVCDNSPDPFFARVTVEYAWGGRRAYSDYEGGGCTTRSLLEDPVRWRLCVVSFACTTWRQM
jgi:hypothetical protein